MQETRIYEMWPCCYAVLSLMWVVSKFYT